MKKIVHSGFWCLVCFFCPAFLSVCGNAGRGSAAESASEYDYRLAVERIIREYTDVQDQYHLIGHSLTTNGPAAGIEYRFVCAEHGIQCGLDFEEWNVKIPAHEGAGRHEITVTALLHNKVLASAALPVEIMDQNDFVLGLIAVPDMTIYRSGGSDTSRAIEFFLFDESLTSSIEAPTLRGRVEMSSTSADFTIVNNVIQQDAVLAGLSPGHYTVNVEVTFDGIVQKYPAHIMVTAEFDFAGTEITGPASIDGAYIERVTQYDVNIAVTLGDGEEARLQPGEYLWINHGAYAAGNSNFDDLLLSQQPDGAWNGTIRNVPAAKTSFNYKIYAVKSNTANDWGVVANSPNNQTFTYNAGMGAGAPLDFTVNAWRNRIVITAGELIQRGGMEPTGTEWTVSSLQPQWTVTGMNTGPSSIWLTGNDPGPHTGSGCFTDYHTSNAFNDNVGNNWLTNTARPLSIIQNVAASSNGLSAGTQVTLSVWILRVTAHSADFTLVCGGQTYAVPLDMLPAGNDNDNWRQISRTFTLAADDIAEDGIKVGLQYRSTSSARIGIDGCRTMVDDFSLVAVKP